MQQRRTGHIGERAAGAVEYVGALVAVAALVGVLGGAFSGRGAALGDAVGAQVRAAVAGEAPAGSSRSRRKVSVVRERRVQGGSDPQRVPRDQLRLTPVVRPVGVRRGEWRLPFEAGGVRGVADARVCLLCGALEWSHSVHNGVSRGRGEETQVGFGAELDAEARGEVASADASLRLARDIGAMATSAQGRVRGMLGGWVELHGEAQLSMREQDLEVDGRAMVGASAHAEGKVGASLLGVAVTQGGSVEGWAGVGVRGAAGVHRRDGRLQWRLGVGAAAGLGGSAEWRGSIDVTSASQQTRQLARESLEAGMAVVRGRLPLLGRGGQDDHDERGTDR